MLTVMSKVVDEAVFLVAAVMVVVQIRAPALALVVVFHRKMKATNGIMGPLLD